MLAGGGGQKTIGYYKSGPNVKTMAPESEYGSESNTPSTLHSQV